MNNQIIIVGISGTHGAGKGSVAEFLKRHGYLHFSARNVLWEEVDKRRLPRNRDSLNMVATELRELHGGDYVGFNLFMQARSCGQNAVIESLYNSIEVESIRKCAQIIGNQRRFVLVSIDAAIKLRYQRVLKRMSQTDTLSFGQFLEQQNRELFNIDPKKHNILACMKCAEISLENNGTLEEFAHQMAHVFKARNLI